MKCYWLDSFKEIIIGFNQGPQMTSEFPDVFPTVSLFKLVNVVMYLQFIFGVAWGFVYLPVDCASHTIWRVRRPDVRTDVDTNFPTTSTGFSCLCGMAQELMLTQIFWQPALVSPACVAWHKDWCWHKFSDNQHWFLQLVWHGTVLLPDVGSSSCYTLDPGQHYHLQVLDVDLRGESEAMWEDE